MNNIADATSLTFDSDLVVTNAADGSAYVMADALPALAAAGSSRDRIVAAKSEATAASRLTLLNSSILQDILRAAPDSAHQLLGPKARLGASVAAYFFRLDQWETRTGASQSSTIGPRRSTLIAADGLFRALVTVLDERLRENIARLERKRTVVIGSSLIVLSLSLAVVLIVGRNLMLAHRRDLMRLEEMAYKDARFKAIFAGSPQAIAITDRDGNVIDGNEAYRILVGAPMRTSESLPLFAPLRSYAPLAVAELFETIRGKQSESVNGRFNLIRSDDSELCCIATAKTIESPSGNVDCCAVILSDVTERELEELRLQRQATHDRLTDVGNRDYLLSCLDRALASTACIPRFALLFIDIDDFKTINDTLGHLAGDACLQTFAQRLRSLTRVSDVVTRYGGDEFAVLLRDQNSVRTTDEIVQRLRRELKAPVKVGENTLVISSSIGIAIDSGKDLAPEEVIEAADRDMYFDKAGKADRAVSIQRRTLYLHS